MERPLFFLEFLFQKNKIYRFSINNQNEKPMLIKYINNIGVYKET